MRQLVSQDTKYRKKSIFYPPFLFNHGKIPYSDANIRLVFITVWQETSTISQIAIKTF